MQKTMADRLNKQKIFASCLVLISSSAFADLDLTSSIETSVVHSEFSRSDAEDVSSDAITIQPSIGARYTAKKINTSFNASHTFIESSRSNETELSNDKSSFTNYGFDASLSAIDRVLSFSVGASQSYNNTRFSDSNVNDQFFGNADLSKTTTQNAGMQFQISQADYIGLGFTANVSKVKSDRQFGSDEPLDSNNLSYLGRIFSGDEIRRVSWNLSAQYRETTGTGPNNLTSESYNGVFYVGLIDALRLVATGQKESNSSESFFLGTSRPRDFKSAGIGLSWQRMPGKRIDITYNITSKNAGERDRFVGVDFDWRFSTRTSVSGNLGRRFFGRSGSLTVTHNSRRFRNSVTYDEQVTNFSQLISTSQVIATIVCPIGATDISQCFLPDSLDYELQAGEQFTNLSALTPEITEESILRKNWSLNTGYSYRRITLGFNARDIETEYLSSGRLQNTQSINLSANLRYSNRTSFSINTTFSDTESANDPANDDSFSSKNSSYGFGISHKLGRNLTTSFDLRHVERESRIATRDLDTNRVTLSLRYTFN